MSEQPHPNRVRLLPWAIADWVIDVGLISILVAGFFGRPIIEDGAHELADWFALALAIVLLLTRRRYPIQTLVVAVAAGAVVVAITDEPPVLLPVALVALFTVALQCRRTIAIIAGAITTLSFLLMMTALLRRGAVDGASLAAIAWPAFAAAAGAAVRSTRENVAAAEERAVRAETSREREAERRVIEERLRIARDVHDLVAHHLAVINVQSGVAGHLMESDPAAAGVALDVVRGSASTAVDQLGELLGVLRSPDGADDSGSPVAPTPDLAAIDDLLASFAASGLEIRDERSGRPRPLSESAEVAAYRVVQEALTNAHKHGDGSVAVALRFIDQGLSIEVINPTSHAHRDDGNNQDNGSGFGLVGMRERVEAVGGSLEAAPSADGRQFQISATIPSKDEP